MLYVSALLMHHSIPESISLVVPSPFESKTLTPIKLAPIATPCMLPSAATIPATCVPWPLSSLTEQFSTHVFPWQSITHVLFFPIKSEWEKLTPVSRTQMVSSIPVIFMLDTWVGQDVLALIIEIESCKNAWTGLSIWIDSIFGLLFNSCNSFSETSMATLSPKTCFIFSSPTFLIKSFLISFFSATENLPLSSGSFRLTIILTSFFSSKIL